MFKVQAWNDYLFAFLKGYNDNNNNNNSTSGGNGNSSGDSIKPISCFIEGDGKELSINEEVEVIEEAICTWVLHQKNGFKKYNVGFKKIRIKSTGEAGWTFSTAVKIPD